MTKSLLLIGPLLLSGTAHAATWEYNWQPAPGESIAKVEIAPFEYGKTWAYGFEIDDGPQASLSVAQPLFARYFFSDAPPGMPGGVAKPFVGTAAIFLLRFDSENSTLLSLSDTRTLRERGWGLANHSYWHTGNHWDKTQALQAADFRRELFWSQAIWAATLGNGRASSEFVYPSGDYNYAPYLKEFGLVGGSRVGGKLSHLPRNPAEWLDLNRTNLDEAGWAKANDALDGLPQNGPTPGQVTVDFTHGIDADQDSPNYKRWQTRLQTIADKWGKDGDDSLWCAPTGTIVAYHLASLAAKLAVSRGALKVELPDSGPGSALTLHLTGLEPNSKLIAPPGGVLYRRGSEAWLTTPLIGREESAAPGPKLERIYSGVMKTVTLDTARRIAGVRLLQGGAPKAGFTLKIDAIEPNGNVVSLVPPQKATPAPAWGSWQLYPAIPDGEAPLAKEVQVSSDPAFHKMEIWALAN